MSKLGDKLRESLRGKNPLLNVDKGMIKDLIEAIAEAAEEVISDMIDKKLEERDGDS